MKVGTYKTHIVHEHFSLVCKFKAGSQLPVGGKVPVHVRTITRVPNNVFD